MIDVMFPLMRLPNELIFRVVNLVHPADIESLVLCNKSINRFAQEALARHLELEKKYSVIRPKYWKELEGSDLQVRNDAMRLVNIELFDPSTFAFMAGIIQNEDIVYYPVNLHLPFDAFMDYITERSYVLDDIESEDFYSQKNVASRKSFSIVRNYIRNTPLLSMEDKAHWLYYLHTRRNNHVGLALLFSLLPNIQSVILAKGCHDPELDLINKIAKSIADLSPGSNIDSERSRKYLSKLQTVTFNFHNYVTNNLEAFLPFAMLPSIRVLNGELIGQIPYEQGRFIPLKWPSNFPERHSTVTEINFSKSAIGAQHFRSFLAGIATLQRFTYHYWHNPNSADFQPRGIGQALEEFAAKSLVSLALDAIWIDFELEDDQYVKSLQKLIALKVLRANQRLFEKQGAFACTRGWSDGKDEPKMEVEMLRDWVVDMFPRDLEWDNVTLLVSATTLDWPWDKAWLLRDLEKSEDEHLPDLEYLTID
ncbi:hypothetical protein G7Y79_00057g091030 [Physcia stellaris]|nr:hypothetical protein G7Y79_00057g091030 [Physcia stellaris]